MLVAARPGDSRQPLVGDTHEVMLRGSSANGINGDTKVTISSVLETNRKGQAGSQFSVELGLGGTSANGSDGDAVGQELGGDGIQHLAGDGHAIAGQIDEHLSRDTQTLVDLEAGVDVGVVDQTFPANGGTGLLEVGAHHDAEVVGELVGERFQASGILVRCGRVVDGAWADDYEKSVGASHDNVGSIFATRDDGLNGSLGERDLGGEQSWRDQGILSKNFRLF